MMLIPPGSDPRSSLTDADAFMALWTLKDGCRMGRGRLGRAIGISEGSARRLVGYMEPLGLVRVEQPGITITKYGGALLDSLGIGIVDVPTDRYVIGSCTCGTVVRLKGDRVGNGTALRNNALRLGGEGCTAWTMRRGRIVMAPDWNVDDNDPGFSAEIRRRTGMGEGDALVVAGAGSAEAARRVAVECALSLLRRHR